MKIGQSFRLAIKSLLTSKVRALLTMLGIIIGVAAVIVIVSLGNGMQQYMNSQFEQIGVNMIQVSVYSYGGNREVTPDDFYGLAEKYPQYIESVSPYLSASTVVLITHDNSIAVKAKRIVRLQDGRIIYDGDAHDPQAVVQPDLEQNGDDAREVLNV